MVRSHDRVLCAIESSDGDTLELHESASQILIDLGHDGSIAVGEERIFANGGVRIARKNVIEGDLRRQRGDTKRSITSVGRFPKITASAKQIATVRIVSCITVHNRSISDNGKIAEVHVVDLIE